MSVVESKVAVPPGRPTTRRARIPQDLMQGDLNTAAAKDAGLPAEAGDRISGGIDLLTSAVRATLGRNGRSVIFGKSYDAARVTTRPADLSWSVLAAVAMLTGIGLAMALFIADLAFGADLLDAATLGILSVSAVSAAAGTLALAWLTSSKRKPRPPTAAPSE
jgi:NhaA family Na+:H+ antiporter